MKSVNRILLYLLLVAVCISGVRYAWLESGSRYASSMWVYEWQAAASNVFGYENPDVKDLVPIKQSKYWLKRIENLETVHTDAELARGAAWVLGSPSFDFTKDLFKENDTLADASRAPQQLKFDLDYQSIEEAESENEKFISKVSLDLAEQATTLDPGDVENWRSRAMLLFTYHAFGGEFEPKVSNWLEILEECKTHDPENGLYDYLVALQLWKSSASYDVEEEYDEDDFDWILTISDHEQFEKANKFFEFGQQKRIFAFPKESYSSSVKLLELTDLPTTQILTKAENSSFSNRAFYTQAKLRSWNNAFLDNAGRNGELQEAKEFARKVLRIVDQLDERENHYYVVEMKRHWEGWAYSWLLELNKLNPGLLSAEEAKQVKQDYFDLIFDEKIHRKIAEIFNSSEKSSSLLPVALLAPFSQMMMIASFVLGIAAACLCLLFVKYRRREKTSFPLFASFAAWIAGIFASLFFLGLCPSGFIDAAWQSRIFYSTVVAVGLIVLVINLFMLQRWLPTRWSHLASLLVIVITVFVLVFHFKVIADSLIKTFIGSTSLITLVLYSLPVLISAFLILKSLSSFFFDSTFTISQKAFRIICVSVMVGVIYISVIQVVGLLPSEAEIFEFVKDSSHQPLDGVPVLKHGFDEKLSTTWGKIFWAYLHWQLKFGPMSAVIVSVALMLFGFVVQKIRKHNRLNDSVQKDKRTDAFVFFMLVVRSCGIAIAFFAVVYMVTHPMALAEIETEHWKRYARMENTSVVRKEVEAIRAEVVADKRLLDSIREEVESYPQFQ